ncbi:hypothetical protein CBR_g8819 [Chara braunii]|uniref:Uncharacterized protein n=1 Tax=Chara braunii TaxID=69332 RepID=A0A388KMW5_CHABU|nr:hypothetical protein CBR_g8819 [Chara braunii]|eukprot:GBG71399.1 hypothetical protein CBR_g8819 [Chara braunii]
MVYYTRRRQKCMKTTGGRYYICKNARSVWSQHVCAGCDGGGASLTCLIVSDETNVHEDNQGRCYVRKKARSVRSQHVCAGGRFRSPGRVQAPFG